MLPPDDPLCAIGQESKGQRAPSTKGPASAQGDLRVLPPCRVIRVSPECPAQAAGSLEKGPSQARENRQTHRQSGCPLLTWASLTVSTHAQTEATWAPFSQGTAPSARRDGLTALQAGLDHHRQKRLCA